jgi:hypothetical protein
LGCIVLLHRLGSVELSVKTLHTKRYELHQLTIADVISLAAFGLIGYLCNFKLNSLSYLHLVHLLKLCRLCPAFAMFHLPVHFKDLTGKWYARSALKFA